MVKCSACGLENPDDGKFCTNCGKPMEQPHAAAAAAGVAFCTNCGARLPADSKFCTGCGTHTGKGAAPNDPDTSVPPPVNGGFLAILDERLGQNGFERMEVPAVLSLDRWMRRKRFELAKAGTITTFCGIKLLNQAATAAAVKSFSQSVFGLALSNKGFFARNAFQQLLVYPVMIAPAYDADVETFLNSYWNRHLMAYEYPVVVSTSTRQITMHRSTPVWGAAFHGSFRREAESLFAF